MMKCGKWRRSIKTGAMKIGDETGDILMNYSAKINGIDVSVAYAQTMVDEVFVPLLKRLAQLHTTKQRRVLVMLAAPPGSGKSTLVSFLEHLAREVIPDKTVQAVGMDGFHFNQAFLLNHTIERNGKEIPLANIKGAPETFDLESLREKIKEVTAGNPCKWPHYDRQRHDPVEDAITVDADIVLLEGNYLLLDADGWRELSQYADYTIALKADAQILRRRLIERKMKTGMKQEDAERFVDFSDMPNVRLCLEKTKKADLVWCV